MTAQPKTELEKVKDLCCKMADENEKLVVELNAYKTEVSRLQPNSLMASVANALAV